MLLFYFVSAHIFKIKFYHFPLLFNSSKAARRRRKKANRNENLPVWSQEASGLDQILPKRQHHRQHCKPKHHSSATRLKTSVLSSGTSFNKIFPHANSIYKKQQSAQSKNLFTVLPYYARSPSARKPFIFGETFNDDSSAASDTLEDYDISNDHFSPTLKLKQPRVTAVKVMEASRTGKPSI